MNTDGPVLAPFASPEQFMAGLGSFAASQRPFASPDFSIMGSYQNDPLEMVRRIEKLENERSGIIAEEKSLRMWAPMTFKRSTSKRFMMFPSLSFIYGSIYVAILLTGGGNVSCAVIPQSGVR